MQGKRLPPDPAVEYIYRHRMAWRHPYPPDGRDYEVFTPGLPVVSGLELVGGSYTFTLRDRPEVGTLRCSYPWPFVPNTDECRSAIREIEHIDERKDALQKQRVRALKRICVLDPSFSEDGDNEIRDA